MNPLEGAVSNCTNSILRQRANHVRPAASDGLYNPWGPNVQSPFDNRRPPIDNPSVLFGYNTNGFAHHRLEDAVAILAEIGYRSVAVTVERDLLDPPDRNGVARAVARLKPIMESAGVRLTIETGTRFILDPRRKHQPTLISESPPDRLRRVEFLKACIDLAAAVSADSVSLWSGSPPPLIRGDTGGSESEPGVSARPEQTSTLTRSPTPVQARHGSRPGSSDGPGREEAIVFERLVTGMRELLDHGRRSGVRLSFEPEPGMFIDTMSGFAALERELDDPFFGLTLDVGHVFCQGDGEAAEHIRRWRGMLWNVHIEDMCRGVHEHLMFGEGEMDFPAVLAALRAVGYAGPVHVELSRHSHDAVETARRALDFLKRLV